MKQFYWFLYPKKIILDSRHEFNNEIVKELLKLLKIIIHLTTPGHFDSNSIVERIHFTHLEHFRILQETKHTNETDLMNHEVLGY